MSIRAIILTALIASCVSSLVTLTAALLVLAPTIRAAPDSQAAQSVVRAERFELTDRSGAVRAIIGADVLPTSPDLSAGQVALTGSHVGMVLQDPAGRPRFAAIVNERGASTVAQLDSNGRARHSLFLDEGGPSGLNMQDARGYGGIALAVPVNSSPGMVITDSDARLRVMLGAARDGTAGLQLSGASPQSGVALLAGDNGTALISLGEVGGRGVTLAVPDEGTRIRLRDDLSRTRLDLGVGADGVPYTAMLDEAGTPIWQAP
ncbi:MAG TPA: hypothetical protein VK066_17730 [Chloroflexota bacterium]|nr:hypothetical protein [Chloroflexota bacterium]